MSSPGLASVTRSEPLAKEFPMLRFLKRLCTSSARTSSVARGPARAARLNAELLEDRLVPSTFWVTNTLDSGPGSLRQAILQANAHPGLDTIAFHIAGSGVHTISPRTDLPTITDAVVIDGTTQPGYAGTPLIALSGAQDTDQGYGLEITAGSSTVRGLVINRFTRSQILLWGGSHNTVSGNFLGTDSTGTWDVTTPSGQPGFAGVQIDGSSNNLIGGTAAAARNVISGGDLYGVLLDFGANNRVQGNFIGTDVTGTHALGNHSDGVYILGASRNVIGGAAAGAGNVIAANGFNGVDIADGAVATSRDVPAIENQVQGNWIGTDRTGTLHLGNHSDGVLLIAAASATVNSYGNQVGGSAAWLDGGNWGAVPAGEGNVIAFNGNDGVQQQGARMFNNPIRGNSIHDNGGLPVDPDTLPHFTPVVQFAHAGSTTTVDGYVSDASAEQVLLDFYAGNPSEFGQSRRYLGSAVVRASDFANGRAYFSANAGSTLPGEVVTVTATGYYGNTSRLDTGKPAWADLDGPRGLYDAPLQLATGHEADGRAVVVALGADHAVYLRVETAANSSVYGPWQPLYGSGVQSVRVATDPWGRLQVLVIGSDSALWVNGQLTPNGTSWSGWQRLYGAQLKQIEVDTNYAGLPVVFAIGGGNAVYFQWESSPGNWSGWYGGVGGNLSSIAMKSIAVSRDPAGRLQVFGLDQGGYPWVSTQTYPGSLSFTSWHYLGGNVQQLSAITDASGRVTLFALGDDNAVYWQQEDASGNWTGWQPLYGQVKSVTAGRDALGRMEVVAVGFDGQVYALHQASANGSWGNWSAGFGGTFWPGTLTLGNEANGTLDVFAAFHDIDASSWGYIRL
jgi:hypothetical protein